jgi:thiol-disulfide isomerase/thioredoxin
MPHLQQAGTLQAIFMKSLTTLIFVLLTLVLVGQDARNSPVKTIPKLSLYDINGDTTNLNDLSFGKVTIIDFWFVPCGACFSEMKMLHNLYSKYGNNQNVAFLTITISDSAFIRPLIENRRNLLNETYTVFKRLSQLDTFKLPVFFVKNINKKMHYLRIENGQLKARFYPSETEDDIKIYPDYVFGFSAYPTIFIFDKNGKRIYNNTGFLKRWETQDQRKLEKIIDKNL